MLKLFAVSDDDKAFELLEKRGWKCDQEFVWHVPHDDYRPSAEEWVALTLLCDEWDYGFNNKKPSG